MGDLLDRPGYPSCQIESQCQRQQRGDNRDVHQLYPHDGNRGLYRVERREDVKDVAHIVVLLFGETVGSLIQVAGVGQNLSIVIGYRVGRNHGYTAEGTALQLVSQSLNLQAVLVERAVAAVVRGDENRTVSRFYAHIYIPISGGNCLQCSGQFQQTAVAILESVYDLIGQLGRFCRLHLFVIVVQKEDLQEPDQPDQEQGEADKIYPQFKSDAFKIKFTLQIQIYNLPL